jgi:hypothetical protein
MQEDRVESVESEVQNFGNEGGNGENPTIDPDADGFKQGDELHFDIDVFQYTAWENWLTQPTYHAHAYDRWSARCNFLRYGSLGYGYSTVDCSEELTYKIRNAHKAAGEIELESNGLNTTIDGSPSFADAMNGTEDFAWMILPPSAQLNIFEFEVDYVSGILAQSRPSFVQKDNSDRDGAFTLQVFCGEQQVWEFVVYQHVSKSQNIRNLSTGG